MRRSASEVIRELEHRIARLERQSSLQDKLMKLKNQLHIKVSVEIVHEEFDFELEKTDFTTTARKTFDDIDDLVDFLEREVSDFRNGYEVLVDHMNERRRVTSLEIGKLYRLSTREDDGLVVNATFKVEEADNSSLEELDVVISDLVM